MDRYPTDDAEQIDITLLQEDIFNETLALLSCQQKRKYTEQEIDEARGNLALMNDRVFLVTFNENKNNHLVKGIADAARKIHNLFPIPAIEQTKVQDLTLYDILGRGMIGDLKGWGKMISIGIEAQRKKQDSYAVRGTLTAGNIMRVNFNVGENYSEAPDAITINILDFKLPELRSQQKFCSRIIRAEYESRETFLADKYSEYYIELPKLNDFTKAELPIEYHDLFDICCVFRAKIKEHEEVIRMQAIANPTALELSKEVRKAVEPNELVNSTLDRRSEALQFYHYIINEKQKAAEKAAKKAAKKAERKTNEKMLLMAIKNNFASDVIEAMQKGAGITDSRLAELKMQAQKA